MAASDDEPFIPVFTDPFTTFLSDVNPQLQSPLFGVLPAEIRLIIFTYTLADYEDSRFTNTLLNKRNDGSYTLTDFGNLGTDRGYTKLFNFDSQYWLPFRIIHTELLRTCKRAFQETWFMPFALAEHHFYLDQPGSLIYINEVTKYLAKVRDFKKIHGGIHIPPIAKILVFFTIYGTIKATAAQEIQDLVDHQDFGLKHVTITLQYFWTDSGYLDASLANGVIFPKTVQEIKMEFCTPRSCDDEKTDEINSMAVLVANKWLFRRADGIVFRVKKFEKSKRQLLFNATYSKGTYFWIHRDEYFDYVNSLIWKPTAESNPFDKGYVCQDVDMHKVVALPSGLPVKHSIGIQMSSLSFSQDGCVGLRKRSH